MTTLAEQRNKCSKWVAAEVPIGFCILSDDHTIKTQIVSVGPAGVRVEGWKKNKAYEYLTLEDIFEKWILEIPGGRGYTIAGMIDETQEMRDALETEASEAQEANSIIV